MSRPKHPKNAVFPDILDNAKVGEWVWLVPGRDGTEPSARKIVRAAGKTVWLEPLKRSRDELGRELPVRFRRDTGQPFDLEWEGRGVRIISGHHRDCFRLIGELADLGWGWRGFIKISPEEIEAVHAAVLAHRRAAVPAPTGG